MTTIAKATQDYVWRGSSFIALHSIGQYEIVEYWNMPADNAPDKTRERQFGVYIDGQRMGHCYLSMDEALIGCVALRHEGRNTRADAYFCRMIGIDSLPEKEAEAAA